MATQNRTELASILNESAFRWSFGSTCEYVKLLESFLKENNLPVPKFPDNFIRGTKNVPQAVPHRLFSGRRGEMSEVTDSATKSSISHPSTFFEFPSYSNTSQSSNVSTQSESSGYRSSPTVKVSDIPTQSPIKEVTLKDLLLLLLWDLVKQYKATCNGSIPDEVRQFLSFHAMIPPVSQTDISSWFVWVCRRISVLMELMSLNKKVVVKAFVDREAQQSNETDMIADTICDMLRAHRI